MLIFFGCIFSFGFCSRKLSILVGAMDVVRGALFFLPNPKDILYFREQLPWKLACLLACCVLSYVPIGIMLPLQSRVLA
jgi:hypothetical protein